jgi:ketosteroid isomerase-like protein
VAQARGDAGLSNKEIFEVMTAAYGRGDIDGALEFIDPEIEWIEPTEMPGSATYHGRDGVRKSMTKFVGAWTDYSVDHPELIEAGDRLLVHAHMKGKGRTSGAPAELHQWQVYTFRDGKVIRAEMYLDEEEARRVVGLELEETK